jgi:hypothetical protein
MEVGGVARGGKIEGKKEKRIEQEEGIGEWRTSRERISSTTKQDEKILGHITNPLVDASQKICTGDFVADVCPGNNYLRSNLAVMMLLSCSTNFPHSATCDIRESSHALKENVAECECNRLPWNLKRASYILVSRAYTSSEL